MRRDHRQTRSGSSRQLEEFIARTLGERIAKVPSKKARPKEAFQSGQERFVIYVRRLPILTPKEKEEVREGLEPIWNAVKDA